MELEARQAVLEAAHLVYYKFWGKNLDEILQPVPDCGNFKHLTNEQILSLRLNRLNYDEDVLLVRGEYEVTYRDLWSYNEGAPARGGVVVTGQPGIGMHLSLTVVSFADDNHPTPNLGKTCFLYYLLLRLLSVGQPVALQVADIIVLFQRTGVQLSDNTSRTGQLPDGTWALTDSHTGFDKPCTAFLTKDVWVVQTTSPSPARWQSWLKERKAIVHWMDVVPLDEIIALG
jgi:hypothetical protein